MKYLLLSLLFVAGLSFASSAEATSYYIDFSVASGGNGLATSTAWNNLDSFTEGTRSAGDIAFVRRGQSTTTQMSTLDFTSDGSVASPVTITADNDNLWGDFSNSSQTYTVTFGSKTMSANTTITGISANDWVYVVGDQTEDSSNPSIVRKDFAYEVASVSGTTLTLYLPYKGNQNGSGFTLRRLPAAPIWGTTTNTNQVNLSADRYWVIQGIEFRGTAASCNITTSSQSFNNIFKDVTSRGDGVSDCAISPSKGTQLLKFRGFGHLNFAQTFLGIWGNYNDFLVDCNNVANSLAFQFAFANGVAYLRNGEIINCANSFGSTGANTANNEAYLRNVTFGSLTGIFGNVDVPDTRMYIEDDDSQVGVNAFFYSNNDSSTAPTTTQKTLTTVRVAGGSSLMVTPPKSGTSTGISTLGFPVSFIKLFEYPIYASSGTPYTYSMYFKQASSSPTSDWSSDPTSSEMWIEAEYYADYSDADRKTNRSTGTLDFNGTSTWQSLSVSATSTQDGILYLRGWYGKAREADKQNSFYMDIKPVITSP